MLTGENIMTIGQYRGKKLKDVPDAHLSFLLSNNSVNGELKEYCLERLEPPKIGIQNPELYNKKINEEFTDDSPMPFGMYKGTKLANLPAGYLLHIQEKGYARGGLLKYITDNKDILIQEFNKTRKIND